MSNISRFLSRKDIRVDEAGAWIAKMGRGLSEREERELGDWLSSSRENHRELMELAELWDSMAALSRLADLFPEPPARRRLVVGGSAWLVAATVILAVATVTWIGSGDFIRTEDAEALTASSAGEYETVVGQQSTHRFSDGTKIVLNTNSLVSVNYTESNRLLRLERGEVYVSVAHDPARPLSVMVGDKIVQAVGTEFNLEITSDQTIELVVSEGLVMVGVLDSPVDVLRTDAPLILTPSSALVAAGQEVSITINEPELDSVEAEPIESDDIAVKLSWRDGNLIFRGESLEEAVTEVGRYTAVEFVFMDEEAKKVRVAGLFKAGDVEGLLVALRIHFNISYEWHGDDKIFLSAE